MAENNTSCSNVDDNATSGCAPRCSTSTPLSINYDQPWIIIVAVALVSVVVTTMFCNLLVGLALLQFRSLRNVSNLLIGNLALSDFLLSVAVLPISVVNECLGHWVFGQTACNVWLLVDVLLCTASIWNLCLIAFDRFTATFYPLWYRGRGRANSHHALAYSAVVWTVATTAFPPPLFGWNDLSANYVAHRVEPSSQPGVVDMCPDHVIYRCVLFRTPSYVLYSASVSFFVPCLVTFVLYVNILAELRRRRSKADALRRLSSDHHAQPQRQLAAVPDDSPPAARTTSSTAAVTWKKVRDSDEPVCTLSVDINERQSSNDSSSPTSASRPLSRSSQNRPDTPSDEIDDDDVTHTHAPADITADLHEQSPAHGLSPLSNSDTALNTSARYSVAETFIHRFRSSAYR